MRWAPHTSGVAWLKPKDYTEEDAIEAANLYAAWSLLKEAGRPLRIGDVLEAASGELHICKYVGLEEARWQLPDQPPSPAGAPPEQSASAA